MKMTAAASLMLIAISLHAQDATAPPAGAHARFVTKGSGVQIYVCSRSDDGYQWILQEPSADLLLEPSFRHIGTHSKGPTWTWADGSAVTGVALQKQDAPDPTRSIPWLLLQTKSVGKQGELSNIAYVRRSKTDGGVAQSAGCTEQSAGSLSRVPYSATYTFYTAGK